MAFALSHTFTEACVVDTWTSCSRGTPPSPARRLESPTAHPSASVQSQFGVWVRLFLSCPRGSCEKWEWIRSLPNRAGDEHVLQGESTSAQLRVSGSGGRFGGENSFGGHSNKTGPCPSDQCSSSSPSRGLTGNPSVVFMWLRFFVLPAAVFLPCARASGATKAPWCVQDCPNLNTESPAS